MLLMTERARLSALEGEVRYLAPDNRRRYRKARKEIVLTIVEKGVRAGAFSVRDNFETTRALLAMCQAIPRWYHDGGRLTAEDVAAKYSDIALTSIFRESRVPA
ncbi:hypothetical protein GON09_005040 [Rhodococcus sp. B50]|nr:hypothetical protein [Rhodococcus sp. B50]